MKFQESGMNNSKEGVNQLYRGSNQASFGMNRTIGVEGEWSNGNAIEKGPDLAQLESLLLSMPKLPLPNNGPHDNRFNINSLLQDEDAELSKLRKELLGEEEQSSYPPLLDNRAYENNSSQTPMALPANHVSLPQPYNSTSFTLPRLHQLPSIASAHSNLSPSSRPRLSSLNQLYLLQRSNKPTPIPSPTPYSLLISPPPNTLARSNSFLSQQSLPANIQTSKANQPSKLKEKPSKGIPDIPVENLEVFKEDAFRHKNKYYRFGDFVALADQAFNIHHPEHLKIVRFIRMFDKSKSKIFIGQWYRNLEQLTNTSPATLDLTPKLNHEVVASSVPQLFTLNDVTNSVFVLPFSVRLDVPLNQKDRVDLYFVKYQVNSKTNELEPLTRFDQLSPTSVIKQKNYYKNKANGGSEPQAKNPAKFKPVNGRNETNDFSKLTPKNLIKIQPPLAQVKKAVQTPHILTTEDIKKLTEVERHFSSNLKRTIDLDENGKVLWLPAPPIMSLPSKRPRPSLAYLAYRAKKTNE